MKRFVLIAALFAGACSSSTSTPSSTTSTTGDAGTSTAANTIAVAEADYTITLSPATVAAGDVTFTSTNGGKVEHELVIFKTDLDPAKMPTKADGTVDEEGAGVEHIDSEIEDLSSGASKSITVKLAAGKYVVLCNVGDHYSRGMYTTLTVK